MTERRTVADIDYTERVRAMSTSSLVLCLTLHEARLSVVDPDGALAKALGPLGGLLDFRPEVRAASAELESRLKALLVAAAAEIDRRIPIPDGVDERPTVAEFETAIERDEEAQRAYEARKTGKS